MDRFLKQLQTHQYFVIFILIFLVVNIVFLTRFPFVHSDEPWLSGLARNMAEKGDFSVTETFFDLKERNPHAIKILYHLVQIFFIQALGYSIFSMRLISLLLGVLTLIYIYKLGRRIFPSPVLALTAAVLLGLDVQFVYASHMARQEIALVLILVLALYYFTVNLENHGFSHDLGLAFISGIGIGVHPNSLIIALPFSLLYLYHIVFTGRLKPLNLFILGGGMAAMAAVFITLSLSFDPDFFTNYTRYGSEFEVFNPLGSKAAEVIYFYRKLFHQVSGTYYTPDIRLQFFLFPAALLSMVGHILLIQGRKPSAESAPIIPSRDNLVMMVLTVIGLNLGIILIGRYNQTSVVFQFPLFYLLTASALSLLPINPRRAALPLLSLVLLLNTCFNVLPYLHHSYDSYLREISRVVSPQDRVLANLNTEYYFANGRLHDYRNLAYLQERGMSLASYIADNKISYIIYPEEMEFIYREQPRWNGMYGPPLYFEELQQFLTANCLLVHEFTDSLYAMRITPYQLKGDWKVRIYRVKSQGSQGDGSLDSLDSRSSPSRLTELTRS